MKTKKKKSISDIFKEKGEIYFRKKETSSLRNLFETEDDFVLSIGGGTPCYAGNMEFINSATEHAFYLKVDLQELVKRLAKEKADRPLIASLPDTEMLEFIGKHLFERSYFYNQANQTISCGDKNAEEITALVAELLG